MSIDRVASVLLPPLAATGQQLSLPTPGDFPNELTLGQIIKGRVLRQYGESRYLVAFGGREEVVDSAIPLTTNEVLYGRVVGLGGKVELVRITTPQTAQNPQFEPTPAITTNVFSDRIGQLVTDIFSRFGGTLNEQQSNLLNQALRNATTPEPLIYAALLLSKLGLPFTLEKLQTLNKALSADPRRGLFEEKQAIYLSTLPSDAPTDLEGGIAQNPELLRLLEQFTNDTPAPKTANEQFASNTNTDTGGHGQQQGAWPEQTLAHALLNRQVDGSVQHRITTIPFVIDGELIELNIGFVDQRNAKLGQEQTAHHRVVFSLQTQTLGGVAIDGVLTGNHVQLKLASDDIDGFSAFETHTQALQETLQQAGFQVDTLRYEITSAQDLPSAPWLALRNVIQNESLDRRV